MRAGPNPWLNLSMSSICTPFVRVVTLLFALAAVGCGSPSPAPDYPTPEDPAVEDTEFAEVLGLNADEEAEEDAAEDDWVDPSAGEALEGDDAPQKR